MAKPAATAALSVSRPMGATALSSSATPTPTPAAADAPSAMIGGLVGVLSVALPRSRIETIGAFDMSPRQLIWFATTLADHKLNMTLGSTNAADASTSDHRVWRRARFAGGAAGPRPGCLSEPAYQDDRALSGGRHHRFPRPPGGRLAQERTGCDGCRREQARRRHRARRGRG